MNEIHPFNGVYTKDLAGKVSADLPTSGKRGLMHRHVEWLNSGSGIYYGAKRILAWMERIILDLTIICVPFVKSAVRYAKRFRAEELGKTYADKIKAENKQPPAFTTFAVSTDSQAMNHATYYAINDGVIWYRPMKEGAKWQPMPFTSGTEPCKIRVDGANLCVEDNKGEIYYRKVLREGQRGKATGDRYVFRDKSERNNFKERWFTLPVVSTVFGPFMAARLPVDSSIHSDWAIAHRGQFNHYIEDAADQKHPVDVGVTTLYMLDAEGRYFSLYDPWKPEWVKVRIPTPATTHSQFEALKFSVAASTLMTIGYETATQAGVHSKTLKIETLLADIDGLGWNPGLSFDYEKNSNPKVRVLGEVKWQEHALPNDPTDRLTKMITIIQTGEGNNARELRVIGSRSGESGFFYKSITADQWQFESIEGLQIDEDDFLTPTKAVEVAPVYAARDYKNTEVTLKDFIPEKVSSILEFRNQRIMVYRKVSIIKKAVGVEGETFDLVTPKSMTSIDIQALKEALKVSDLRGITPAKLLANLSENEKS